LALCAQRRFVLAEHLKVQIIRNCPLHIRNVKFDSLADFADDLTLCRQKPERQIPDHQEKPKGFKEHCKLAWDSFWEFANLPKLGNHLLGEIPAAMKRAPILFIICFAVISLLFSKGCDKSSQISGLKDDKNALIKDKEFLQQSFTATGQSNANFQSSYQLEVQKLNEKSQEQAAIITQLIQARDKAQIEQQNAENALASWIYISTNYTSPALLTDIITASPNSKKYKHIVIFIFNQ
jgi:hypothetical protein